MCRGELGNGRGKVLVLGGQRLLGGGGVIVSSLVGEEIIGTGGLIPRARQELRGRKSLWHGVEAQSHQYQSENHPQKPAFHATLCPAEVRNINLNCAENRAGTGLSEGLFWLLPQSP